MHRTRFPAWLVVTSALVLALAACGEAAPAATIAAASPSPTPESTTPEPTPETTPEATHHDDGDDEEAEEVRVRIASSVFDPRELTITPGTTVIFLNADSFAHTVTEGENGQAADGAIVDQTIEQNRTVRVTFDEPGTYPITCRFHPTMQMTITVEG